ncbi:DNA-directed RNA polymerase subunit delta [Halobacillus karajensis]|uniref:Probable DNA-directed RNA polymerase subunit delta n=1 Tax=Halobacillus karajensis TaxID=195088 RepID=A0A024P3Y4_9BACI|nr:DNA-directed RNA polymerase subunit delta [Halobacillus karajensis]CDQ18804.1 RNAP delta factor [Halobacillus karajensis]CDQ23123.1 RNAP delta factor [Halobacillus karajensis]CDQ26605.1 RNAP delta factor [Halobacillus karajensis]SEH45955.1 DNA-directed RNA polymerase subunit delta [Halobacillus karajensis]
MSLKEMSQEQIQETSMIVLATKILEDEREAIDFNEIFNRIAAMKDFTDAQKEQYIAQFYTDMNIDGQFMTIGTNRWGLKKWYPVEQMEEEIANLPQKRKKKKKKKKPSKLLEDELGVSEFDADEEELEDDLELTDEDLDLDDDDDDFEGDYEEDDLDEEEEEIVEDDVSFIGDDDEDK